MDVRPLTIVVALLLGGAVGAQQKNAAKKPPRGRELDNIVELYLAADGKTERGHALQLQLLERVKDVELKDARQLAEWRRKIAKSWRKGTKLQKSGDNWFWPRTKQEKKDKVPERGRYIVGGETRKPKGLAITMHGGGQGSGDAGSAAGAYEASLQQLGLLMIAPEVLKKTAHGWTDAGTEEFVMDLVDAALRTFKIDPNRVYFVGHSMGGYGSWTLGGHHADRIAAIAPSAGAPTPIRERRGGPVVDIIEGVTPSLRNVFVSVYQSLDDPRVPPEPNQFAVKQLRQLHKKWGGYSCDYWEVDGRGHAGPPGGYVAQLRKIVEHTRDPVPERLLWQPVLGWKRQFYWLYWDKPIGRATVRADIDRKKNAIHISCEQATAGLHVLLDERLVDVDKEVVVTVNGNETFRGMGTLEFATLLRTSSHPDPMLQFARRVPAFR